MGPCETQLDLATVGPSLGSARVVNKRPRENGVWRNKIDALNLCAWEFLGQGASLASLALMWS